MLANLQHFMFKKDHLEDIVRVLHSGGLLLYPTDTIWGVGCDACNAAAIDKLYKLKNRPSDKGFVLLVSSISMLKEYVSQVSPRIETLLAYHTRPLTIVYPKATNLPSNVCAPDGSIAIRIPKDGFCRMLIEQFGKPLVATSANISGEAFPPNFGTISSTIIKGVDYVVREQQEQKVANQPSVIAKLSDKGELIFLRN